MNTSGDGEISWPEGITIEPDGIAYVASTGTHTVQKYDASTGAYLGAVTSSQLIGPKAVRFGPEDGLMYVASSGNNRILRFDSNGNFVDDFVPAGSGGMDDPYRIEFGPDGDLYVSALGCSKILRFGSESEAVFTASLSTTSSLPVTVDFLTADGPDPDGAEAGSDYTSTTGMITFPPGIAERTVLVPILNDSDPEATETFTVSLDNAIGGVVGDGQGIGTIVDDDGNQPPADVLYVYDIRFESTRANRDWRAVFEIRSDSDGDGEGTAADDVAAGVWIRVEFDGAIYEGTTDADGVFRTSWIKNLSSGDHEAEVVDLVLENYDWIPLTLDLEGDSDGDGLPDNILSR